MIFIFTVIALFLAYLCLIEVKIYDNIRYLRYICSLRFQTASFIIIKLSLVSLQKLTPNMAGVSSCALNCENAFLSCLESWFLFHFSLTIRTTSAQQVILAVLTLVENHEESAKLSAVFSLQRYRL